MVWIFLLWSFGAMACLAAGSLMNAYPDAPSIEANDYGEKHRTS